MPTGLEGFIKTLQSSGDDGGSYALDMLKKNPTWIQPIVTSMIDGLFLPEALLRNGPPNNGSIAYREAEPMYADDDIEIVGEWGTYPALTFSRGPIRMSATQKRGAAIVLSQQMIDRGDAAQFVENARRATNTFAKHWSKVFLREVLANTGIPQMTARAMTTEDGWHGESENTGIRKDMAMAKFLIQQAKPEGDARTDEQYNFEPDTLVIHPLTATMLITNGEINKIYENSPEIVNAPIYKLAEPRSLFGLTVLKSWEMPVDPLSGMPTKALMLQRKKLGFISDERPFRTTPLYENKDNETWRSNMSRISTMAIDNPKAALWINGINGVNTTDNDFSSGGGSNATRTGATSDRGV